jgi:dGTP triphosphohydrolase
MKKEWMFGMLLACALALLAGCTTQTTTTKTYTPGGQLTEAQKDIDNEVLYELNRIFATKTLKGEGLFESDNVGLARSTAISLAVRELAAKVQTMVKANTVVYNNKDVRDVVETQVMALVQNYEIEYAAYQDNSKMYHVVVRVEGEQLVKEIQRYIQ